MTSTTETRVSRLVERARSTLGTESAFPAWSGSFFVDEPPDSHATQTTGFQSVSDGSHSVTYESRQTPEGYALLVEVPGFETPELSVRFVDGLLSVRGETAAERGHATAVGPRRLAERFALPASVDTPEITASHHSGVLEITLPTGGTQPPDEHIEITG